MWRYLCAACVGWVGGGGHVGVDTDSKRRETIGARSTRRLLSSITCSKTRSSVW
jgi:hypothetical protein